MEDEENVAAEELFPIPLAVMQPGTTSPMNLYIRYHDPPRVLLYKKAWTPLREDIRERLMAHEVQRLYLLKRDEKVYHEYVEQNINRIIKDDLLPSEEAAGIVYDSSSRVMEETFQEPRSGRNLQRAHTMVEATVQSILRDPEALWHMAGVARHDYYTYTHCVHVSMFLITACRDLLGIRDEARLRKIGVGGIFHDIGKSQISEDVLNKPGKLSADEFELIKKHPGAGVGLVRDSRKVDRASMQIIRSHHEHFDGGGYPRGLRGEGIDRVSRLACIVDVYDALTTHRPYADAREPYDALDLMLNEMSVQFDPQLLRGFVKFLGPRQLRSELRAATDRLAAQFGGPPQSAGIPVSA